jgi:hypothetical protein
MLVVQFFTTYLPKPHIKNTGKYLSHNNIQGDQKENKSRVPSHLNVCLSLIVHMYTCYRRRFIGCLFTPFRK